MIKVAFLNPTIPPRVVSLLNRINQDTEIEVHGFFYAISQKNRNWQLDSDEYEAWQFQHTILNSASLDFGKKDYFNTFISFDLFKKLSAFKPDVILLPGWSDVTSWLAWIWGSLNGVPVIMRTESTSREKNIIRTLTRPLVWLILNTCSQIIGSSQAATTYAKKIAPKTKATTIFSSFDTKSFAEKSAVFTKNKDKITQKLGITQEKICYFNGQLIERKGIPNLLTAWQNPILQNYALVITGGGLLEPMVCQAAQSQNVYYFGYQRQNHLPLFYGIADLFILPSYEETWGLVVVEAMAAGVPCVVSDQVGAQELIDDTTGWVMSGNSSEVITTTMQTAFKANLANKSKTAQKKATEELSYESVAQEFVNIFKTLH